MRSAVTGWRCGRMSLGGAKRPGEDGEVGGNSPRDRGNPDRCPRTVSPRDKPLLRGDQNDPLGGNKSAARFVH